MLRSLLKRLFHLLGKSDHKLIAVFAASREAYSEAVEYVRAEAPGYPIWLLACSPVDEQIAARCERVLRFPPGPRLLLGAARALWPHWAVLSVVTFTKERGYRSLKAAPLLVPPWKLLIMNEHGDFFNAFPLGLAYHGLRRALDKTRARDLFWKITWALIEPLLRFTSTPWRHPVMRAGALGPPPALCPGIEVWAPKHRQSIEAAVARLRLPYQMMPAALPAAAATTNYQYVLAAEEAPAGDLRDLMALLERPDAFAAAFQAGRRGFQRDILPRGPFRQLQPGEATGLIAPLAPVTLIHAGKLAQLGGFPKARSQRCRWLQLYWKAAQAGWRSYCLGSEGAQPRLVPERAFAEAEFCFRLLGEPRAPRQEPASWEAWHGSVCFHPRSAARFRQGKRRILVLSPYLPFPLSHGGAVRILNLARHLSTRWDLLLLSFRERNDSVDYQTLSSLFAHVMVVDQDERSAPEPSSPQQVAQFRSRAMSAAIREAAQHYRPDLLQVEYTQLAGYRAALPHIPAVLVEHDITFHLHEQLFRAASSPPERRRAREEWDRWRRYESQWLPQYEAVAVMSEQEKQMAVEAGARPDRTWVVPNGVDTERFQPASEELAGPPEALFVGSFRHLPNLMGFENLRQQILPRLWRRFPHLLLRVVAGLEHETHWRRFAGRPWPPPDLDRRITVEGFVEDLRSHYRRAQLVVVPLPVSAGTNIKVMEALSCGKPVVSTPVGCAGLELKGEEEILIAGGAEAFAAAIERLLEQPGLARRIGEQGRRVALQRFSWERAAARAAEMYEAMWICPPSAP